jgi:hypothetical protein
MNLELHAYIQPELDRGEKIIWAGRPNALKLGWRRGGMQMLFMIPWTAFALFWTWGATGGLSMDAGFGLFGLVWGGMFVAVGLFVFTRSVLRFRNARHTLYAVTNKRVMELEGPGKVTSYSAADLGTLNRRGTDARGDVVFGKGSWEGRGRGRTWVPAPGLIGVENPREVESLIREYVLAA